MSFQVSHLIPSKVPKEINLDPIPDRTAPEEEWVEIIEPKSKTKIYANLDSGTCAISPPDGVTVLRTEDFEDHWWELFDRKTGKYYYYNPRQQKTVWTRPSQGSNTPINGSSYGGSPKKKLLIIPVSKLQTFKKLSSSSEIYQYQQASKCDASTQTIASNLVTTGTQTFSENELSKKLNEVELSSNKPPQPSSPKLSNVQPKTNRISSRIAEYQNAFKSQQPATINHRELTEFRGKTRTSHPNSVNNSRALVGANNGLSSKSLEQPEPNDQPDKYHQLPNKSSHIGTINKLYSFDNVQTKHDESTNNEQVHDYFTPPPPPPSNSRGSYQKDDEQRQHYRRSIHLRDSTPTSFRPNSPQSVLVASTSTFKKLTTASPKSTPSAVPGTIAAGSTLRQHSSESINEDKYMNSRHQQQAQPVITNNLSHYLVREARAMGIALISDDELDDDDQESDDEFANDDDEDTDLRDDLSITKDLTSDLHASQDFDGDSSECGWRSFSDQESPNIQPGGNDASKKQQGPSNSSDERKYKMKRPATNEPKIPRSPISCETSSSTFRYDNNELIDDKKDPKTCMSQQLDNQKLVDNFKKTRQTSALGFNDSFSRSYRLDTNNAVQRLKTVADTYFNSSTSSATALQDKDPFEHRDKTNDKYLRHLSTLSTLPRTIKTKPPQVPQDVDLETDPDYDVVEENCNYYSDSERRQASLMQSSAPPDPNKSSTTPKNVICGGINQPMATTYFDRNKSTRGSTFSVESFARENLTRHPKKGGLLFNRKVKWSRMISWTKNSIKQPMISSVSSDLAHESIASFKLIQQFMGDRKIALGKRYRQLLLQSGMTDQEISSITHRKSLGRTGSLSVNNNTSGNLSSVSGSSSSNVGPSANHMPDKLRDELAYDLIVKGCVKASLRDEIFIQLARQLTENPKADSINWGLVLMSILLSYFSPSTKFAPFLLSFLETHAHQMARDVCLPRLTKQLRQNWLTYCRKPADGKEISIVRLSITKWPQYCGIFGESLERIMSLQACSSYLSTLRLPWILTTLGDKLLETGGTETEGIFRCAADHDLLAQLRLEIDCVDLRKITDAKQLRSLLSNVDDPHVIAGLLKLFFRQLSEPVFPTQIYETCLSSCHDPTMACRLFNEHLPNLNKDVVAYLIRLLQLLSEQDKVISTKMDTSNLSMVWAPNLLRAADKSTDTLMYGTGHDSTSGSKWSILNASSSGVEEQQQQAAQLPLSQSMIFEQTRQEMQFIKLLITNLETSFIENVL